MRNIGIIGLLVMLMTTLAFAQEKGYKKTPLSPEAKAALKDFRKNEVYPVKKALHDDFMSQLSAEDRSFIAAKRQEQMAIKEEAKAMKKQLRAERQAGQEVDRKAVMAPIREKQKALLQSMRPFLEQHQVALDAVEKSMKAHQAEWKNKRQAIVEQHTTAEEREKMQARRDKMKAKRQEAAQKHNISEEDKMMAKRALFVLWDGELKERKGKRGRGKKGAPRGE